MNKISKYFLGILASALLITPSFAGEMTVTGSANASYVTNGDDESTGKNIGVANELDFTASGELDNGMTWTYQVQLDGANTANDDTKLVIGTDFGTIGIASTEMGLSQELSHSVGALGTGYDHGSPTSFEVGYDVSDYANIQYHTPADMLPFGAVVRVGYVPDMNDTSQLSNKESNSAPGSQATGRTLQMANITLSPMDGLSIGGDVAATQDETGSSGSNGTEQGVSANLGASYTMGQFSVGYMEGGYQPAVADGEIAYYETQGYGIQFDVNDALSVSYNKDKSNKVQRVAVAVAATAGTTTETEMESTSIQLAYTTGGATIGIAQVEVDNSDYTAAKDEAQTMVTLAIAF